MELFNIESSVIEQTNMESSIVEQPIIESSIEEQKAIESSIQEFLSNSSSSNIFSSSESSESSESFASSSPTDSFPSSKIVISPTKNRVVPYENNTNKKSTLPNRNPAILRIVKSAVKHFKKYDEEHQYEISDDDIEDDVQNRYVYIFEPSQNDIFSIKNKNNIIIKCIKFDRFIDEEMHCGDENCNNHPRQYNITMEFETPNYKYRKFHNKNCIEKSRVLEKNLFHALKQVFHRFNNVIRCSECLDINVDPVDDTGICLDCSLKFIIDQPKIECSICQETTVNYITLPCTHSFHSVCFSKVPSGHCWNPHASFQKCPLCRARIATEISEGSASFRIIPEENHV